jgi:hypothetical protein
MAKSYAYVALDNEKNTKDIKGNHPIAFPNLNPECATLPLPPLMKTRLPSAPPLTWG